MLRWLKKLVGLDTSSADQAADQQPDELLEIVIECPFEEPQEKEKPKKKEWRVHLELDLRRDGAYVEVMDREPAPWTYGPSGSGAVLPFNDDGDNDAAPAGDHEDRRVVTELDLEDLTELRIRLEPDDEPFPPNWSCLVAVDHPERIRIFDSHQAGAGELIGPISGRDHVFLNLNAGPGHQAPALSRLGMEAVCLPDADFDGLVTIGIALVDEGGALVGEERAATLRVTPWLMSHHLQPVETVYVIDKHSMDVGPPPLPGVPRPAPRLARDGVTGEYVDRLERVAGGLLTPLAIEIEDNWSRDMFYGGSTRGPGMPGPILQIVRCPTRRGRSGEDNAYTLVRRHHVNLDHGWAEPIAPRDARSDLDSGGNILCAPPVDGHPFGRIVYGHDGNRPMSQDIVGFLNAQGAQAPFQIDTSWLQVGHADEVLTFIPWPKGEDAATTSSHGFRVLVASPATALRVLERNVMSNLLFRGRHEQRMDGLVAPESLLQQKLLAGLNGFSVADVLACELLVKSAAEVEKHIDAAVETLIKELGIRPGDVMRMPVLFHRYGATQSEKSKIDQEKVLSIFGGGPRGQHRKEHVAFTPNVVNMLVLTGRSGAATLCIPTPFGPSSGRSERFGCAFEAYISMMLAPSGNAIHFIDDFDACHLKTGEIHCTTFEVRQAPENPAFWLHPRGGGSGGGSGGGGKPVLGSPPKLSAPPSASDWRAMLNPGQYLDDEVMRRYYAYLRRTHPAARAQLVDPASSFMILNNINEVEAAAELAALTQNDVDLVFFPINNNRNSLRSGGTHWTLIVFDRARDELHYYDSLNNPPDEAARRAHERLRALYQSRAPLVQKEAPQQQEVECGVYVLLITEHLLASREARQAPDVPGLAQIQNPRGIIRQRLG